MDKKRGKKQKEMFSLKKQYKQSWEFLKESKNFIFWIIFLFFIFTLIGFFIPISDSLLKEILKFINELLEKTKGMSQLELIWFIFLNNLEVSFFGMVAGIFLGIFSIIFAISNGLFLGIVSALTVQEEGYSVLLSLLPHGIFELSAIFISLGLGLKFGSFIFKKKKKQCFENYFWNCLRVFFFIVVPLLIVAAIIEGSLIFLFR